MPSRREFLQSTVGGLTAVSAPALARVAAADMPRGSYQPDHVTLTYDKDWLETYRPRLELETEAEQKLLGYYGLRATSPEYETDVGVTWMRYGNQVGVTEFDSHRLDHEPYYVFVDSETGELVEVVASIYHWLAGRALIDSTLTTENGRPAARVISPWHQYTVNDYYSGSLYDVEDLTAVFEDWLDGGLREDLHPGAVVNPWVMRGRSSWWREGLGSVNVNELQVKLWRDLGLAGPAGTLKA